MSKSPWQPSPEQAQVIDTWGQGLAVMAGAGSGKTTTIVYKCLELVRRNPEAKFAAVSFTERSASDLRERLTRELGASPEVLGHWVMTIHGMCSRLISDFPREAGMEGDEGVLSEVDAALIWNEAVESLWFDELPPLVAADLDLLLTRETRASLVELLIRVKNLEVFGTLKALYQSQDPETLALARLSEFVLQKYDRVKRRRGQLDFNDLERGAERVLTHEEIARHYQRKFDLILVDEFQDTNPVQADLLWKMVKGGGSNLCVVGDPKQSIYGFRDADVTVFEEYCGRLPVHISLTRNYRSRPEILEVGNRICEEAFRATGQKYEALEPQRESVEGKADHGTVEKLEVYAPVDLARWIQSEVARGVPLSEMVLLVRKIRGNEKWFKALSEAGIPIAVGSGGLFWSDPRVRELVSFLKWWDLPKNALSGAIFLRAPWVGVSDLTLDEWIKRDPTWTAPFFVSDHPMAEALKPFHERRDQESLRPGQLLLELLISTEIEQELGSQLIGLWHRAEELSSSGLDFHAVVSEFGRCIEDSRREREVPPPKNQGQLLVLTLHGAKGLEFPQVILLDFPTRPQKAQASPLLYWDRKLGVYLATRTSDGDREKKHPIEDFRRQEVKRRSIQESMRLLYVALTRARERLILVFPMDPDDQERAAPIEEPFERDFWRGWIEASGVVLKDAALKDVARAAALTSTPMLAEVIVPSDFDIRPNAFQVREFKPRHSATEWSLLARCPRAYEWTMIRPRVSEKIEEKEEPPDSAHGVAQKTLGSQVHRCLETQDVQGLMTLQEELGIDRFNAAVLIEWMESSSLMRPATSDGLRKIWTELAFEVQIQGQGLVGSMDRLILETTSQCEWFTLIDYKITKSKKSKTELIAAYQSQLEIYALALHQLEPKSLGRIRAVLVSISPGGVQEVEVALANLSQTEKLAQEAALIVGGQSGAPRPGEYCRYCPVRVPCLAPT